MSLQLCWSLFCIKHLIYFYFGMACRISPNLLQKVRFLPWLRALWLVEMEWQARGKLCPWSSCWCSFWARSQGHTLMTPFAHIYHLQVFTPTHEEVHKTSLYMLPPGWAWPVRLSGGIFCPRRENSFPGFFSQAACLGSQHSPCTNPVRQTLGRWRVNKSPDQNG